MVDLGCELDLGRLERVVRREVQVPVNGQRLISTLHENHLPVQTVVALETPSFRQANSDHLFARVCPAPIPLILLRPFLGTTMRSSAIYLQEENTACIRTVTGTHDGRLPLEEVVADRSSGA